MCRKASPNNDFRVMLHRANAALGREEFLGHAPHAGLAIGLVGPQDTSHTYNRAYNHIHAVMQLT